jgi:hypothetical protein
MSQSPATTVSSLLFSSTATTDDNNMIDDSVVVLPEAPALIRSISALSLDDTHSDDDHDDYYFNNNSSSDHAKTKDIHVPVTEQQQQQQQQQQRKIVYRVRFMSNENSTNRYEGDTIHETISWRDMTDTERYDYWWTEQEQNSFKSRARRTINKTIRQSSNLIEIYIDRWYRQIRHYTVLSLSTSSSSSSSSSSITKTTLLSTTSSSSSFASSTINNDDESSDCHNKENNHDDYMMTILNPSTVAAPLVDWYHVGGHTIGLEKYLTRSKSRSRLASNNRRLILEIWNKVVASNNNDDNNHHDDMDSERAHDSWEEANRTAILFARCHGYAAAVEAKRIHSLV